jgi:YVTN family beta-propeller protein
MMKKITNLIFLSLLVLSSLAFTGMTLAADYDQLNRVLIGEGKQTTGKIVTANRAAGTLSIIDTATDQVIVTVNLPAGDNPPEPMYAVYVSQNKRIFVGDRANNRVVVFRANDFSVEGIVPAGQGIWHMWAHNKGKQLWVNNDIDNTATVIDTKKLGVIATVAMPADLIEQGGKPHDVILDEAAAYITMVGLSGNNDYVIKFDRENFQEVARAAVGKDPHVILTKKNDKLYVASQNSNTVQVLKRHGLAQVASIPVPGAHGVWIPRSGRTLYVTNLPNGGTDGLFTIDLETNAFIGEPIDTAFPTPHNLVATKDGRKLYLTHSGATADKVTVYAISKKEPVPVSVGEITVGLNPFGLAFVPDAGDESDTEDE